MSEGIIAKEVLSIRGVDFQIECLQKKNKTKTMFCPFPTVYVLLEFSINKNI